MPYIGNTAANRFVASKAATQFSGDGSTTAFTLEHSVGADEDILVSVDGVVQEPSVAYAVSNGTTLTFTAAPSSNSGNNIFVYYLFRTVGTVSHPSNNALQATTGNFTGAVTANAGIKVDNITIDGTEIDLSGSGDFTVDVGGDIILDTDGQEIFLKDDGTHFGGFKNVSNDFVIKSVVSDKDIIFQGTDGGSGITALTLDMSAAGDATFNNRAVFNSNVSIGTTSFPSKFTVSHAGTDNIIETANTTNSVRGGMQADTSVVGIGAITNHTLVFRQNNSEVMRHNGSNFLIGTTDNSPAEGTGVGVRIGGNGTSQFSSSGDAGLSVNRTSDNGNVMTFRRDGTLRGRISVDGSSTSYITSSDYRLKENVTYDFDATTRLKQLKPARFNFIGIADKTVDGFLAHEVQIVVPEAIDGEKDATNEDGSILAQGIDYGKIVPLLVKTIQELEARITALENA